MCDSMVLKTYLLGLCCFLLSFWFCANFLCLVFMFLVVFAVVQSFCHYFLDFHVFSLVSALRIITTAQISLPYYVHGITFGSEIQFMRKLSAECSANLHLEPVQQTRSFDLPVLVFCVTSTRVGTDAAAALRNCESICGKQSHLGCSAPHFRSNGHHGGNESLSTSNSIHGSSQPCTCSTKQRPGHARLLLL
uniref:uncharacterized protein isoform X3 n=1 Tax=Myxine glutinosa TaxID=7769 RepID=UPI00358FC37A